MKKFTVEITETLQRQIEVEAEDENEAISKVEDMYRNEEVVLDSGDYIDTDFNIIDKNGEKVGETIYCIEIIYKIGNKNSFNLHSFCCKCCHWSICII